MSQLDQARQGQTKGTIREKRESQPRGEMIIFSEKEEHWAENLSSGKLNFTMEYLKSGADMEKVRVNGEIRSLRKFVTDLGVGFSLSPRINTKGGN